MAIVLEGCVNCQPGVDGYLADAQYARGAIIYYRGYLPGDFDLEAWERKHPNGGVLPVVAFDFKVLDPNGEELTDVQSVMPGKWARRICQPVRMCECVSDPTTEGRSYRVFIDTGDYQVVPLLKPLPKGTA